MYTKYIPKKIQEKLKAKERALAWKTSNANESSNIKDIKPKDIQSRTTFVRMCSNKIDSIRNVVIAGGKRDFWNGKMKFGLNKSYTPGNLYEERKSGIRPTAGVKNIEVSYKGSYKAIREATVSWMVGSIEELDELTPYFLTVGKTVILDWGWINTNTSGFSDFDDVPFITLDPENGKYKVNQQIFTDVQTKVQNMGGDYDAIGGKVSNFESTMRPDGGFDCVTKVTALGSTLFTKPIDKPTNQISIIPRPELRSFETADAPEGFASAEEEIYSRPGITEEEIEVALKELEQSRKDPKSQYVATDNTTDNIINGLINLKEVIVRKVFNLDFEAGKAIPLLQKTDVKIIGKDMKLIGFPATFENNHSVYLPDFKAATEEGFGIVVDNKKNPQVCWMNMKGEQRFFVKWGWMEDQLMNRYLSYNAGEGEDRKIKITFRSIRTKLDSEGKPKENEFFKDKNDNQGNDGSDSAYSPESPSNGNPGYPFLTVNWSNPYSKERRESLAKKHLYDTYEEYKTKKLADRKRDWDNSPELWNVKEIIEPISQDTIDVTITGTGGAEEELNFVSDYSGYGQGQGVLAPEYQEENPDFSNALMSLNNEDLFEMNYGGVLPHVHKVPSSHTFRYEKESIRIRNNKNLLKPIDPFKFWSQELLPDEIRIGGGEFSRDKSNKIKYVPFYNAWKTSKIFKISQFTPKEKSDVGILRNMWVNVEEIQKAFGIDLKAEGKANPPGTFERGIKNLLHSLNNNFFDMWDFELAIDPYDSTNMGVVDKKVNSMESKSLPYTRYKNEDIDDKDGKNSFEVQTTGIYKFPSFKVGSIVKNQNLSFKIPDAMALTILYGSNKPEKKSTNNSQYNNPQIMRMFGQDNDKEYDDKFLKDMMPANSSDEGAPTGQNVGSFNTHPNSEIVKGQGVNISGTEPWYKEWSGDTGEIKDSASDKKTMARTKYVFSQESDDIIMLREETEDFYETTYGSGLQAQKEVEASYVTNETRGKYKVEKETPFYYTWNDFDRTLILVQGVSKLVRNRLNGSIKTEDTLAEKLDPIIPAELSLEIDGIGGIVPGDVIHTDYIQEKYRREIYDTKDNPLGPYTYFQIVGLTQRVSPESWTTELTTKMRINYIPADNIKLEKEPEIEPAPQRPSIPVPTDIDWDELMEDDVVLEELDFDDFEEWDAPPIKPVIKTETSGDGIGHGIPNLKPKVQKVERVVARYHPSAPKEFGEVTTGFAEIPEPSRPYIPVPTPEIDIEELSPEEMEELENYNPEFDDFADWDAPPIPFIGPMLPEGVADDKRKKIEDIAPKEKLKGRAQSQKLSTYKGTYAQNDLYLYSSRYKPEWRPIFEYANGRRRFYDIDPNTKEEAVSTIKAARDFDERQQYWDDNIEPPQENGKSKLNYDGYNVQEEFVQGNVSAGSNTSSDYDEYFDGEFGDYYRSLGLGGN